MKKLWNYKFTYLDWNFYFGRLVFVFALLVAWSFATSLVPALTALPFAIAFTAVVIFFIWKFMERNPDWEEREAAGKLTSQEVARYKKTRLWVLVIGLVLIIATIPVLKVIGNSLPPSYPAPQFTSGAR